MVIKKENEIQMPEHVPSGPVKIAMKTREIRTCEENVKPNDLLVWCGCSKVKESHVRIAKCSR